MKKNLLLIIFSFLSVFCLNFVVVEAAGSSLWNGSPQNVLDNIVWKANENDRIQDTSLDGVNSYETQYVRGNPQMRITNTLTWLKDHIHPYLQWIVFFGLSIATILVIYNGFLMVTNGVNGDKWELKKVQKNFMYIAIWVIVLVGFYFLLDIVMGLVNLLAS